LIPFGIDGALIFSSGFPFLLRSRIARAPAIPARAAPPATSGVFAFDAIRATARPALLAAPRLLPAALRPVPVDVARGFAVERFERFRLAWLPFELRRRDLEEACVLDEPPPLDLRRLLLERLLDDFAF
jgi:hypothetical protein